MVMLMYSCHRATPGCLQIIIDSMMTSASHTKPLPTEVKEAYCDKFDVVDATSARSGHQTGLQDVDR